MTIIIYVGYVGKLLKHGRGLGIYLHVISFVYENMSF